MEMEMDQEFLPVAVKREPSVDYLLILPPATADEPTNQAEGVKPKWGRIAVAGCQEPSQEAIEMETEHVNVKQESPVDYLFILPPPKEDSSAPQQAGDVTPKRGRAKKLTRSTNVFMCDKCSYQTKVKSNLTRHKGTHNKSIECETCEKKFARTENLKRHQMQQKHGIYVAEPAETFDCNECGKSFSSAKNLRQHQSVVHDDNEVSCGVCNKIFKNRHSLLAHSRIHVKDECSICHKTISKFLMSTHMRTHSTEDLFECDICNYSTNTKPILKDHIERIHLLRKLLDDSESRDDFDDFELLGKLQLRHGSSATTSEKNFKCEKCGKAFVTQQWLNRHKKNVHSEVTFKCKICKKAFKSISYLNQHKAGVHLKVSCSICGKMIGQRCLKRHMKIHQAGHHFECDLCAFKAEKKSLLKRHINSMHRNGSKRNLEYRKISANLHSNLLSISN